MKQTIVETVDFRLNQVRDSLMTEDTNKTRREKFDEETARIRDSNKGISETAEEIEEVRKKYYNSKWEKMEEDRQYMADYKRYSFILGSGLLFALIFGYIFGIWGALITGVIGVLVATAYMTKPGLHIMESLTDGADNSQQVDTSNSQAEKNLICTDCGWQNPRSNNFCIDCGRELGTENE